MSGFFGCISRNECVNDVFYGTDYHSHLGTKRAGMAFYDGKKGDSSELDMYQWINAIINDTDPCVLPEQALVVSEILEAIYTSHKTGKTVYFD